jgi:hypothetical protein
LHIIRNFDTILSEKIEAGQSYGLFQALQALVTATESPQHALERKQLHGKKHIKHGTVSLNKYVRCH